MTDAIIAAALVVLLTATAVMFAAVSTRGLISLLLAAWLLAFTEVQVLALALSPVHSVGRVGYALLEFALFVAAFAVWQRAGRPRPSPPDLTVLRGAPMLTVFGAGVAVAVFYELVLCVTVPPNNWDSLTYHLARAAAWYQHGGVGWIANAPTERQNAFPAGAELEVLGSFVATHSDRLAAMPQFVAQAAAVVATYGIAVRVGFVRAAAAFAALLVPTLAVVALESTTTQNDLVVASLVAAGAYFVLSAAGQDRGERDAALAGLALALAVGTKLTAALALPGILVLAFAARLSRRGAVTLCLSLGAAFAALDSWVYVENVVNTGHVLGQGGGRVEHSPALTPIGWLASLIRILYRFLDLSGAPREVFVSGGTLLLVALLLSAIVFGRRPRAPWGGSLAAGLTAGTTILTLPLIVLLTALVLRTVLTRTHFPIAPSGTSEGSFSWGVSSRVHEDFSYAGPLGLVLLVALAATLRPRVARNRTRAALPIGFLLFLAGVAGAYRFNDFVGRFMLVAVVVAAPLLASVYRWRALAAGVAALALTTLVVTNVQNELKPVRDAPWSLSRAEVLGLQSWQNGFARGVEALGGTVPEDGCIGALLGGDDAAYPLFGADLRRRVSYIAPPPPGVAVAPAKDAVIVGPGVRDVRFAPGWRVTSLGGYWQLAVRVSSKHPFACSS
jgi:hypothetical protein